MPISWNEMIESGFDPKLYHEDPPLGCWVAKIDLLVYAKTRGIHLYLSNGSGEKFWIFTKWLGGSSVHNYFKDFVSLGDQVQIDVQPGKRSGKPFIKTATKL